MLWRAILSGNCDVKEKGNQFKNAPYYFYFRDGDKENVLITLKSPGFASKFQGFISNSIDKVNSHKLVSNITNTLMDACTSARNDN